MILSGIFIDISLCVFRLNEFILSNINDCLPQVFTFNHKKVIDIKSHFSFHTFILFYVPTLNSLQLPLLGEIFKIESEIFSNSPNY